MFPNQKPRTFHLWGKEQKGRNTYTQAFALAQEIDHTLGTDVPFPIERQPIKRINTVVSKDNEAKPETKAREARVLGEELLSNDSLGG